MKKNTAITHFKMFIIINLIIGLLQLQFASINAYADDSIGIAGVSESTNETEEVTSDSEEEMKEQIEANYQKCLKSSTSDNECRKNRTRMYNELEESSESGISTSDQADAKAKANSINNQISNSIPASILNLLILTMVSILATPAAILCFVVPSLWAFSAGSLYLLITEAWNISRYQKDVKKRNFEYKTNVDKTENKTQAKTVESVINSYDDRLKAINTKLSNLQTANNFFLAAFSLAIAELILCMIPFTQWAPLCTCTQWFFTSSGPNIDNNNSWDLSSLEYNRIASGKKSSTSINRYLELPLSNYQKVEVKQKTNNSNRIKNILGLLLLIPDNAYANKNEEANNNAINLASSNNEEFNATEVDEDEDWYEGLGVTVGVLSLLGIGSTFLAPALGLLKGILKPLATFGLRWLIIGAVWAYGKITASIIQDNIDDIVEMKGKYEVLLATINSQNNQVGVNLMKLKKDTKHSITAKDTDTSSVAVASDEVLTGTDESMVTELVKENEFKKSTVSDPFQDTDFSNIGNIAGNLTQGVQDTLNQNNTGPAEAAAGNVDSAALKKLGKDLKNQINSNLKGSGKPEIDFDGGIKQMQDDMKGAIVKTLNGLSKDELNGLMSSFGGGLDLNSDLTEEEGEKEDDFDAKRLAARNKKPEDDEKKDESIKGLDMNLDFAKKIKKTQGSLKSGRELSKYKSNIKDITKNDKVSIFKILTIRYIKSAFPIFLKKKKQKKK